MKDAMNICDIMKNNVIKIKYRGGNLVNNVEKMIHFDYWTNARRIEWMYVQFMRKERK